MPARNAATRPDLPVPSPVPGMHQPPQALAGVPGGMAPPVPEANPAFHPAPEDAENLRRSLGMLIGGGR
jgi:hypothetical protein